MTSIIRHKKKTPRFIAKSNYVKPYLTPANIEARLSHCFSNMLDFVHVDEKWFYLTKVKRRYYVYDDEEVATRSVKSKHYITKVVFLAAVALPATTITPRRFETASNNCPKGTLVTVPQAVDSTVYFDAILNKVVPAIMAKFPGGLRRGDVFLQQGNAIPHRCVTTELLQAKGVRGIVESNQPTNSPDFNVLDFGFFSSIQSLQHQKATRSIEELIGAVESAFYELPADTVAKTFITLQKVLEMSIEMLGSNDYKLPHMRKDASIADFASYNVEFDASCYESALTHFHERLGEESTMEALVNSLD
ncbi:hypothetical protein AaE_016160 [Aphanomyces astaci]|uniref:Uncharacterized protein n=1 Tax=Aphanomyces astaci TaxID=112090 RepID=A0A6A4YXE2_APHAT|nr:hypothetical protein AaE_016160 [Aphanomyces astaci]